MKTFVLEVLTPEQTLYWGQARSLNVRALDGDVTVLPQHAPYLTVLAKGKVTLQTGENEKLKFDYVDGVLDVSRKKVSVLVNR